MSTVNAARVEAEDAARAILADADWLHDEPASREQLVTLVALGFLHGWRAGAVETHTIHTDALDHLVADVLS